MCHEARFHLDAVYNIYVFSMYTRLPSGVGHESTANVIKWCYKMKNMDTERMRVGPLCFREIAEMLGAAS